MIRIKASICEKKNLVISNKCAISKAINCTLNVFYVTYMLKRHKNFPLYRVKDLFEILVI